MLKRTEEYKNLFNLSVLTLIVVVLWMVFDIYRTWQKTTVTQVLQNILEPIEPSFDRKTLDALKQKKSISEEELSKVPELNNVKFKVQGSEATASSKKEASGSGNKNNVVNNLR